MSKTILCQIKRAKEPYYIEGVDLHITSMEELCYYLQNNLPLIDLSFFNMNLLDWIETELEAPRLVEELYRTLTEDPDPQLSDLILPVMREAGWCDAAEEKAVKEALQGQSTKPIAERLKEKADALVSYKKYVQAIHTYDTVLHLAQTKKQEEDFVAMVQYNRGVAYARLFQYHEAIDCMRQSYMHLRTREALRGLLFCIWQGQGEEAYRQAVAEWKVDEETADALKQEIKAMPVPEPEGDPEQILQDWMRAYRRETDA